MRVEKRESSGSAKEKRESRERVQVEKECE